jgi:hypothetical protein
MNRLAVAGGFKGSPRNNARYRILRAEDRPAQANLQRRTVCIISHQAIAQGHGKSVRRPAHGHSQAAVARPAKINDQGLQTRIQDVQRHEKARIAMPRLSRLLRRAVMKASAWALSP